MSTIRSNGSIALSNRGCQSRKVASGIPAPACALEAQVSFLERKPDLYTNGVICPGMRVGNTDIAEVQPDQGPPEREIYRVIVSLIGIEGSDLNTQELRVRNCLR
jgi:hypothetical protein